MKLSQEEVLAHQARFDQEEGHDGNLPTTVLAAWCTEVNHYRCGDPDCHIDHSANFLIDLNRENEGRAHVVVSYSADLGVRVVMDDDGLRVEPYSIQAEIHAYLTPEQLRDLRNDIDECLASLP